MNIKDAKVSRGFKALLTRISPKLNTYVLFLIKFKRPLSLKNPKTLNEKIQWLKLNRYINDPLVIKCADKYRVREYIKDCGCPELLNELIGVYDSPEEINWAELPSKFALKSNYASGLNLICMDKCKLDIPSTVKTLKSWGKSKKHLLYSEMHYSHIKRKLLCEKFIESDKEGVLPDDYKFYCFHGKAKYVMLCLGREMGNPKFYFFDKELNLARINRDSKNAPEGFSIEKTPGLMKMFDYAERLSKPFSFVRVDFYLSDNNPIFGELTFTPAAGMDNSRLPETDLLFGNMLKLPIDRL